MKAKPLPIAFIAVEGNPDFEGRTPLTDYIDLINQVRINSFGTPPLKLYWSLIGPRIKDQYHAYDPVSEKLQVCCAESDSGATTEDSVPTRDKNGRYPFAKNSWRSPQAQFRKYRCLVDGDGDDVTDEHETRATVMKRLRAEIKKDIIFASMRTQTSTSFAKDFTPILMYVHEASLRRTDPPPEAHRGLTYLSNANICVQKVLDSMRGGGFSSMLRPSVDLFSNDQRLFRNKEIDEDDYHYSETEPLTPTPPDSDRNSNFEPPNTCTYVEQPSFLSLLPVPSDSSNAWSRTFTRSGILPVRYTRFLNSIRHELGLPPLSIYWTASTRNKLLKNARRGLVLHNPVLHSFQYTGHTTSGALQDQELNYSAPIPEGSVGSTTNDRSLSLFEEEQEESRTASIFDREVQNFISARTSGEKYQVRRDIVLRMRRRYGLLKDNDNDRYYERRHDSPIFLSIENSKDTCDVSRWRVYAPGLPSEGESVEAYVL